LIADLDRTSTVPETVLPEPKVPAVEIPQVAKVEMATVTSPIANVTKTGNYRIQVYSLRDKAEAEQHKQELAKGGFDVFLKKAVSAGQDWYIVYVGPFSDINSAKVNLKALKFSGRKPILLFVSTTS
jgi:cell division protein FtsN